MLCAFVPKNCRLSASIPRPVRAFPPDTMRFHRAITLMLCFGALVSANGCAKRRVHKSAWMTTERDAARYLERALQHDSADERRDALVRLSRTRYANHDVSVDTCSTIARTDASPSVRTVAIRLIAESRRSGVAQSLLEILGDGGASGSDDRVHVEVLHALYFLQRNEAIPDDRQEAVATTAAGLLRQSASRDVRISAARLLGRCPGPNTLKPLVSALDDSDFGVVYHVEHSLIHLTGVAHDHDAQRWRQWLDETETPFATLGQLDHTLKPPGRKRWWQRMAASVKRTLSGFRPKQSDG